MYEDPTYLGFYFRISTSSTKPADAKSGVIEAAYDYYTDGLFRAADDPNSAIYYLKSRGEGKRAEMLTEFVDKFTTLINNSPWYLTSVSGVGDLWKFDPAVNFRGKEKKITFETLESIDLKITYLLDLYRKASFDTQYMRYMLPENLRFFSCELTVAEIRNIQTVISEPLGGDPIDETLTRRYSDKTLDAAAASLGLPITGREIKAAFSGGDGAKGAWNDAKKSLRDKLLGSQSSDSNKFPLTLSSFNEIATFLTFELSSCEFSIYDEAPKFLDALKNTAEGEAVNSFSIKVNHISEKNTYGLLGAIIKDTQYHQQRYSESSEMTVPKPDGVAAIPATAISDYEILTKSERAASDTAQSTKQKQLQDITTKSLSGALGVGGALGNAINNLQTAAQAEAMNAVSKVGNVYGTSPSSILAGLSGGNLLQTAKNLLSKATSPELAAALLSKVDLQSPTINKNVSPAKVESSPSVFSGVGIESSRDLVGTTGLTSGDTDGGGSATFAITGTDPSVNLVGSPGNTVLMGPSTSSATPGKTDLLAPPTNSSISPNVSLEDSGATLNGNPGNTVLTGNGSISDGVDAKVELTGLGDITGSPGSVELTGKGNLSGKPGAVDLEGSAQLEGNPGTTELRGDAELVGQTGTTELTGEGELKGSPGKTVLVGKGDLTGNPGKTILEGMNINLEGSMGTTQLTGDAKLEGTPGNVEMEGKGKLEGNPGIVEMEGTGKLEGKLSTTELTGQGNLVGSLPSVPLSGTGSIEGEAARVELEAPAAPTPKLTSVILEGKGKLEGNPGATKLQSPETQLEGYLGKTDLEGSSNLVDKNIGTIPLEGTGRLEGKPGSVNFTGAENKLESHLGKTPLEAPKLSEDMPESEELIAPPVAVAKADARVIFNGPNASPGTITGSADMSAPPVNNTIPGIVSLDGPSTTIDGLPGSADMTAPPTNLISDNLGNSNPEQTTSI